MRKKLVLLSAIYSLGTSCREDNSSFVEKENISNQPAKISLSAKLDKKMIDNYSREYGKILRYVIDANKNLENISEINKSVNAYILNNSQIFDVKIVEQKHTYVARKEKITLPLDIEKVIWNSDDSYSSIIANLEKYK